MKENINTKAYWETRFSSSDWEEKGGRQQTRNFAKGQIDLLKIEPGFEGTIIDFGCGLGDAMPVYRKRFPHAELIGVDISKSAVNKCRDRYGEIASFISGDHNCVPKVDIIIASNVFEHLTDDLNIARSLLVKCKEFHIIVPYKEFPLCSEHVNSYDENYFSELRKYQYHIFRCAGWSALGVRGLWYNVYFKNIFRFILNKQLAKQRMQIIFSFRFLDI